MHFLIKRIQKPFEKYLIPGLGKELYKVSLETIIVPKERKINNTAMSCQKDIGTCLTIFKQNVWNKKTQLFTEEIAPGLKCNNLCMKQIMFGTD